jgi:hypothetical protein
MQRPLTSALAAVVVLAWRSPPPRRRRRRDVRHLRKNLIKNPGARAGAGVTAVGAYGVVPGWTNTAGQFGGRVLHVRERLVRDVVEGLADARKNYFFGGTTTEAVGEGNSRHADDQAAGGGRRAQGGPRRLDRELRAAGRART